MKRRQNKQTNKQINQLGAKCRTLISNTTHTHDTRARALGNGIKFKAIHSFHSVVWFGVVCGMCHASVFVCAGEAACISGPTSPKRWQFSLIEVNCTMNSPIQTHTVWNITLAAAAAAATAAQKMHRHYTMYDDHITIIFYTFIAFIHTLLLLLFYCCCPLVYFPHEFVIFSMHFSCAHAHNQQEVLSAIGRWVQRQIWADFGKLPQAFTIKSNGRSMSIFRALKSNNNKNNNKVWSCSNCTEPYAASAARNA